MNSREDSKRNSYSNEILKEHKWSKKSKGLLLKGLRKYGHNDINQISKMIPQKDPVAIKAMINKLMQFARGTNRQKSLSRIDSWLQSGLFSSSDYSTIIPQVFLYIHLFEKQPQNSPYDFSKIYYFLYHMMLGSAPIDLPFNTQKMLYNLLVEIGSEKCPDSQKEVLDYVGLLYKTQKIKKVYPGKKSSSS